MKAGNMEAVPPGRDQSSVFWIMHGFKHLSWEILNKQVGGKPVEYWIVRVQCSKYTYRLDDLNPRGRSVSPAASSEVSVSSTRTVRGSFKTFPLSCLLCMPGPVHSYI